MAKKQFKAVPDTDDLLATERDLRFHPATTDNPRVLTSDQIDQFNREGFLRGIRIFDTEEIDSIRQYFDDLLEKTIAEGGDSYSISTAHLRHGRVFDLLTDRRIVGHVCDLLGENLIAWGSHCFCKMPQDGKHVDWHQDASYWPLTPSKAVTVWLAVDDADTENACMRFIAGSHHFGHLTYRPSDPGQHNVLNQSVDNPEQYGQVVDDMLSAGEISIHSDLLLHGSEANGSDRRRCGLTLRYCTADVRAGLDWHEKGVLVHGSDPANHWANPAKPAED